LKKSPWLSERSKEPRNAAVGGLRSVVVIYVFAAAACGRGSAVSGRFGFDLPSTVGGLWSFHE
jgi:hypothetical protein